MRYSTTYCGYKEKEKKKYLCAQYCLAHYFLPNIQERKDIKKILPYMLETSRYYIKSIALPCSKHYKKYIHNKKKRACNRKKAK